MKIGKGITMTRKQALEQAIRILTEQGMEEAAAVLQKLLQELPFRRWTDEAVRDSVEQFILDHGRVPTGGDFKRGGLPPHPVITRLYGMTLRQWLDQNYPISKPTKQQIRKRAANQFREDYLRIRPESAEEFNAKRTQRTYGWYTVARLHQTTRWSELLKKLDLPVYSSRGGPDSPPQLRVKVISDYGFEDG